MNFKLTPALSGLRANKIKKITVASQYKHRADKSINNLKLITMKTRLVIKGAFYQSKDEILVPHYTGEFFMVDCDRYMQRKEWKEIYSKEFRNENKDNFVEVDGTKYFYAEYSPMNISDEWELLSDLSDLVHEENKFDF